MQCHLCNDEAIAIFMFTEGCYCDKTPLQPLCLHHSFKSGPNNNGFMVLVEDLSYNKEFTKYWTNKSK